jgi:hypothetical protein
MGTTEQTLRSYPKQVRLLARRYDILSRKIDSGTMTNSDLNRLDRLGDELAFRCMWGNR